MGNVSHRPAVALLQKLIVFRFCSRRRKECTLVRRNFEILIVGTYVIGQFDNHR